MTDDDDLPRFVYVDCWHGKLAAALLAEYKLLPERFHMHVARLTTPRFIHLHRIGTPVHYRLLPNRRAALVLRHVERLTWPDGAVIDPRSARDRFLERRARRW